MKLKHLILSLMVIASGSLQALTNNQDVIKANGLILQNNLSGNVGIVVTNGGTGVKTLTVNGVVLGNGTSPVVVVANGTTNQLFTAMGAGNNPIWRTPTTGGDVFLAGAGATALNLYVGSVTNTFPATSVMNMNGNIYLPLCSTNATSNRQGIHFLNNSVFIHAFGQSQVAGNENTYVGFKAGNTNANNTAVENAFFGANAGPSITTASYSVALGNQAGFSLTTGISNVLLGRWAGYSLTTGGNNVYIGETVGYTGAVANSDNTIVGFEAAYNVAFAYAKSTLIGSTANFAVTGVTNSITLGYGAKVGASNTAMIGATNGNASAVNVTLGKSTAGAKLDVAGTTILGTGNTLFTGLPFGSAVLNSPSVNALSVQDLTVTVTGAAALDEVVLGTPAPDAGIIYDAWVSGANTVTVRANNFTATPIDPASATFNIRVIHE